MPAYDSLASAYLKSNPNNLETVLLAEREVLNKDNNYGLAQRLLPAWTKHCCIRLSKTFISLSLNEIMKRLYMKDIQSTEEFILKLVKKNEISVRINLADGIVTFDSEFNQNNHSFFMNNTTNNMNMNNKKDLINNAHLSVVLENCIQNSMELSQRLREMQKNTVTSYKYLMKNSTSGGGSDLLAGGLGSGMPLSIVGRGGGMGMMEVDGFGIGGMGGGCGGYGDML